MESKGASLYAPASNSVDMTRSTEEDSLVDGPLISADALHSAIRREFQTIPTPGHAILLSLLHMVYVVLSMCVAVLCVLELGQKKHHHGQARSRGYLQFYRQTQGLKHLPLTVHSAGNVLLLVILAVRLSSAVQTYLLLSVLGFELLVALPCLLYYTVQVMRFNRERAAPDVSQEEHSLNHSVMSLPRETGFREGSSLQEVVEKQADLIEYLKQHNTLLSKRLLNLTAQH
ncbi:transmembrane protein 192 isoform X2 [Clinocottus analis]|uniref:transmembrane protein 192 isoform X2 n=1 Tax=Clinocottus analis TaxID=304258 RepID=UPI0035BFAF9F